MVALLKLSYNLQIVLRIQIKTLSNYDVNSVKALNNSIDCIYCDIKTLSLSTWTIC